MKVKLSTFNLSDTDRRAIADYYGHEGLADRNTCRGFLEGHAWADLECVRGEWLERQLEERDDDSQGS
jgi:hypothetical protein